MPGRSGSPSCDCPICLRGQTERRMGKLRCSPTRALNATVAHLGVAALLLSLPHVIHGQQRPSVSELLQEFEGARDFWRQFEVAKAIATANDPRVLPRLESWLTHEDRHLRGNAAFLLSRLGDGRGFGVIVAILNDRSETREVHTISSTGRPYVEGQIREDRYYAAHLLGDLKDARAIPILVPLLTGPRHQLHCSVVPGPDWRSIGNSTINRITQRPKSEHASTCHLRSG